MSAKPAFIRQLSHTDLTSRKTISLFAGVALLVNNITGPGVPQLANMFSEAGWLFPCVCFVIIWLMTTVSTAMFAEAMRLIPGNEGFKERVEFTSVVKFYFGQRAYQLSQVCLNGALQSLNIISVIQSTQVMDQAIAQLFGETCGLNLSPFPLDSAPAPNSSSSFDSFPASDYFSPATSPLPASTAFWSCTDVNDLDGGNPWGCHVIVSLGFLLCIAFAFPMGYFDLDNNMTVQVVAFVLTLMCWGIWVVGYGFADNRSGFQGWSLPAVNTDDATGSQAGVVGTILFNFGFVTTVPSWINEKKRDVSVNNTVWTATVLCICIFFVMGIPGAMAFRSRLAGIATNACTSPSPSGNCAQSVMDVLSSNSWLPATLEGSPVAKFVMKVSVYLFPLVAVLSSIPVFSIVVKYNCLENGMKPTFSFLWGVVAPWLVALPLINQPDALNNFISYSSLVFVSITDFLVPFCLYISIQKRKRALSKQAGGSEQTESLLNYADEERDFNKGYSAGSTNALVGHESSTGSIPATSRLVSAVESGDAPEHYALPLSWGCSSGSKIRLAVALAVSLAVCSLVAFAYQVKQSASNDWSCVAVGT